jgi:adenylate cyclase
MSLKSFKKYQPYILNILILSIFSLILSLPYFKEINTSFTDKLQGEKVARDEIVLLLIDDKSLSKIGAWPWNRDTFADLITKVDKKNPRVIGLDVLFLETRDGDDKLIETLHTINSRLVLPEKIIDQEVYKSIFSSEKTNLGYVNLNTDSDGKIRTSTITKNINSGCYTSFSYEIIRNYLGLKQHFDCQNTISILNKKYSNNQTFSYYKDYTSYSVSDILDGTQDPNLKDKIVLIGVSVIDLKSNVSDNFISITGNTIPGITIHAHIINSFLNNDFIKKVPWHVEFIFVLCITSLLIFFYKLLRRNYIEIFILVLVITAINIIGLILYEYLYAINFININVYLIISYFLWVIFKYWQQFNENKFIREAFSTYINNQLLEKLIQNPKLLNLEGEKRYMTILFSDIRNFTSLAERTSPEDLFKLTNNCLTYLSQVILDNNGTIDKFIGDAIMAFWNAPLINKDHTTDAIISALQMREKLKEFNKKTKQNLNVGIAVHTGPMMVGNLGCQGRFDYTVLGDNVNLCSRLEGLTKKYGVGIIVTRSVIKRSSVKNVVFRKLDKIIVKGRTHSLTIYEPMKLSKENSRLKLVYTKALNYYFKGNFVTASKLFSKLSNDPPSKLLLERIKLLKVPPGDWKGIWSWIEK